MNWIASIMLLYLSEASMKSFAASAPILAQPPAFQVPAELPRPAIGKIAKTVTLIGKPKPEVEGALADLDHPEMILFLFRRVRQSTQEGLEQIRTTYMTSAGEGIAEERFYENRGKVIRYELDFNWIHESYAVDLLDQELHYELFNSESGKHKTRTERLKPDQTVIIGGGIVDYVHQQWSELSNEKKVKFRFAIPDLQDTFSFDLNAWKNETVPASMRGVKMKPSSLILDLIVGNLKLHIDPQSGRAVRVLGRSFLLKKTDKGLKPLFADMQLRYL
jgi:hypothetical protein